MEDFDKIFELLLVHEKCQTSLCAICGQAMAHVPSYAREENPEDVLAWIEPRG
jgi:hypothetical protein